MLKGEGFLTEFLLTVCILQKQSLEVFYKKKLFLKIFQYSQENSLFSIKFQAFRSAILLKRDYEICQIIKNIYFEEHLRTATSDINPLMPSIHKTVKHRLKILQHFLGLTIFWTLDIGLIQVLSESVETFSKPQSPVII